MTGRTDNSRITKVLSTLVALLEGPKSPGELMASTGCAHTTTWLHITALKDMGLVRLKERRKPPHGGDLVPVYEHSLDQCVKTNQTDVMKTEQDDGMDTKEAIELRKKLECDVLQLLEVYQEKTCLTPTSIALEVVDITPMGGDSERRIGRVRVRVEA